MKRRFPSILPTLLLLSACVASPIEDTVQGARTTSGEATTTGGGLLQPGGNRNDPRLFNPPATATPTPAATATATPTPAPPTPTPTPAPTATPTSTPTPLPAGASPTATPANFGLASISAYLYDETGAPVGAGSITVTSLDATVFFNATSTVTSAANPGLYNIGRLPAGIQLKVTAEGPKNGANHGWTQRSQVVTLDPNNPQKTLSFGTKNGTALNADSGLFVSRYPEVASVDFGNSPNVGELNLHFSEPFDSANQLRIANAVRVYPANIVADPSNSHTAISDLEKDPTQLNLYTYDIDSTTQDAQGNTPVKMTWNDAGDVLTMTFPLSFLQSVSASAVYQVTLYSAGAVTILDQDAGHNALGQSLVVGPPQTTQFGNYGANQIILNCFQAPKLVLAGADSTPERAWGGTHTNCLKFNVVGGTSLQAL